MQTYFACRRRYLAIADTLSESRFTVKVECITHELVKRASADMQKQKSSQDQIVSDKNEVTDTSSSPLEELKTWKYQGCQAGIAEPVSRTLVRGAIVREADLLAV